MNVNDIQKGVYLKFKDQIWQVIDFQHVFPGKGNAFVRTKLKNLETGKVLEQTFKVGETVEKADVEITDAQFLYESGGKYFFMDNSTYEQFEIEKDKIENLLKFLKDDQEVLLVKHQGIPINITLPKKIKLKVVEAPPGVKGDSASSATKTVKLETGYNLNVPLFINEGDEIIVNTETGEYVERV